MTEDKEETGKKSNRRSFETIAGTGPGLPDDALGPGETLQEPPSDEEVERADEALGAPGDAKKALPLEGQ